MKIRNRLLITVLCVLSVGCDSGAAPSNSSRISNKINTQPFEGYYPTGCTLNNASTVNETTLTCECIKDVKTGNIWIADGTIQGSWDTWCNNVPGTTGYDPTCQTSTTPNNLEVWNKQKKCGLTGGWHLPTAGHLVQTGRFRKSNPEGGDWHDLYELISLDKDGYEEGGDLSAWMNNHGFKNIQPYNSYCSNNSEQNHRSWGIKMFISSFWDMHETSYCRVLLVHSGQ